MKSKVPDITFVIVTWNNEKEIANSINTIEKHTKNKKEIIVVDNASKDNTVNIIKSQFPEVIIVESKTNLGFAKANNLALNLVTSRFVCFINPDVLLTEDIVTPSINILNNNESIGIVACSLKNLDGTSQPSAFRFANSMTLPLDVLHVGSIMPKFIQKRYFYNYCTPEIDFEPEWVIGAELMMRTSDAKSVGGFSTEYFMYTEDMDLCKKIHNYLNKKIYFISSVSLIHIGGASEAQNINYNKQKKLFQNTVIFLNKFGDEGESRKVVRNTKIAYLVRSLLLFCGYWKNDRAFQLQKTRQCIYMLKEIKI